MVAVDDGSARPPVRLRLLGGFRLVHDGYPVRVGTSEQRLLAYLALRSRGPRSTVAGTLWPDVTERRAQGCLRTALWRLGRLDGVVLAESLVVARPGELRLAAQIWVDVAELNRWIRDRAAADAVPLGALRGGELLPDWGDEWVLLERERLRQLRLHGLELAARQLAAHRRYAEALDLALEAVRAEPLRESAHRTVIGIHFAEGNVGEGLRQYRLFQALLRADLAAGPSLALRALVRDGLARAARG
jgi:DNA-binding SARP family transcriptional activator